MNSKQHGEFQLFSISDFSSELMFTNTSQLSGKLKQRADCQVQNALEILEGEIDHVCQVGTLFFCEHAWREKTAKLVTICHVHGHVVGETNCDSGTMRE